MFLMFLRFVSVDSPFCLRCKSVDTPMWVRRMSTASPSHLHRMSIVSVDIRWRTDGHPMRIVRSYYGVSSEAERRINGGVTNVNWYFIGSHTEEIVIVILKSNLYGNVKWVCWGRGVNEYVVLAVCQSFFASMCYLIHKNWFEMLNSYRLPLCFWRKS